MQGANVSSPSVQLWRRQVESSITVDGTAKSTFWIATKPLGYGPGGNSDTRSETSLRRAARQTLVAVRAAFAQRRAVTG